MTHTLRLITLSLGLLAGAASAQQPPVSLMPQALSADSLNWQADARRTLAYWGAPAVYLDEQTRRALAECDTLLQRYPPAVAPQSERRAALHLLDAVLHDTRLDGAQTVTDFCATRLLRVARECQRPCKQGLHVYKLYNHGFIVRTPSVTLAYDVVFPRLGTPVADSVMAALADAADVLFISHRHADHSDPRVVQMFLDRGKPVWCGPDTQLDKPAATHLRPTAVADTCLTLPGGKVRVQILPGEQRPLPNNHYIVTTPEGFTVAQTGDEQDKSGQPWLGTRLNVPHADVLMMNAWSVVRDEILAAYTPTFVITGHENEMRHTIDHRESLWQSVEKFRPTAVPTLVMAWGEHAAFSKKGGKVKLVR